MLTNVNCRKLANWESNCLMPRNRTCAVLMLLASNPFHPTWQEKQTVSSGLKPFIHHFVVWTEGLCVSPQTSVSFKEWSSDSHENICLFQTFHFANFSLTCLNLQKSCSRNVTRWGGVMYVWLLAVCFCEQMMNCQGSCRYTHTPGPNGR